MFSILWWKPTIWLLNDLLGTFLRMSDRCFFLPWLHGLFYSWRLLTFWGDLDVRTGDWDLMFLAEDPKRRRKTDENKLKSEKCIVFFPPPQNDTAWAKQTQTHTQSRKGPAAPSIDESSECWCSAGPAHCLKLFLHPTSALEQYTPRKRGRRKKGGHLLNLPVGSALKPQGISQVCCICKWANN